MRSLPDPTSSPLFAQLAGLTGQGRQAFLDSLSQHARLLTLESSLGDGALLVDRFSGREAMSTLFRLDVDCLATTAHYELKTLIGEQVSLRLLLADGGTRLFHGMVSAVSQSGSDGSLAAYRLTMSPWMHSLTLRRDNYVFQDKSVAEIVEEVFKDYPDACYRFALTADLPPRSMTIQYRESDYDFVARLMAEEGLNFFFEHVDATSDGPARHRLVIFDDNAALVPCAQSSIRFHRADATEDSDTVTLFAPGRRLQANAVSLASWDYKTLTATSADDGLTKGLGDAPPLEMYEGAGAYRYTDSAECARIARARAESLTLAQHSIRAESSVRALAVGNWFALTGHASADGEYAVLAITHHGANNFGSIMRTLGIEHGSYRNQFECVPLSAQIRPAYWIPKPVAPGAQVALVVGVAGEEISTGRDHRVKLQFPWQRGTRAVSGQHDHPTTCNAPGDERAGTWVRVAEPAAGANWGAAFIPRIGQEVLVDFIAGDIDRPVVIGQLYNGADAPPFHGGDNHPGALAGMRTKEYAADGFNQWVIDDTPGQLRQSVASSYAGSQLNIGYLIRQTGNERGAFRGCGFESATDAWSTLRAKRGLFVSTTPRARGESTQLDTTEAQQRLKAAGEMAQGLSDAATKHRALPLSTAQGLQQLGKTITDSASTDGHHAPAFAQPVTLIDSSAGVSMATPASSVLFAGQDVTLSAESALRMTGGQAVSMAAANTASLFAHDGGVKVVAAKEAVSVRAHTGPMDLLADQAVTVTSTNGSIKLQAKEEILLASGGGYIRLAGNNIEIHCPASVSVSVKGVAHDFLGAGSNAASLSKLPDTRAKLFDEAFVLKDKGTGKSIANHAYRIKRANGTYEYGKTDGEGRTHIVSTHEAEDLIIEAL